MSSKRDFPIRIWWSSVRKKSGLLNREPTYKYELTRSVHAAPETAAANLSVWVIIRSVSYPPKEWPISPGRLYQVFVQDCSEVLWRSNCGNPRGGRHHFFSCCKTGYYQQQRLQDTSGPKQIPKQI